VSAEAGKKIQRIRNLNDRIPSIPKSLNYKILKPETKERKMEPIIP